MERQGYGKTGSPGFHITDLNIPLMSQNNGLGYTQAETGSLNGFHGLRTIKFLKDLLKFIFGNAYTGILDSKQYPVITALQSHGHRPFRMIIIDRILQKIGHCFCQGILITHNSHLIPFLPADPDMMFLGQRCNKPHRIIEALSSRGSG